jgi:predicted tellurium resistance membrane protein TerC
MFIGLIVAIGLAVVFAMFVTFIVSIFIGILYFSGLIFLIVKVKRINRELLLRIHFNLALILKNENERVY